MTEDKGETGDSGFFFLWQIPQQRVNNEFCGLGT